MVIYRTRGIHILSVACELLLFTVCYWVWLYVAHGATFKGLLLEYYVGYNLIMVMGIMLAAAREGHRQALSKDSGLWHVATIRQMTFALALLSLYLVASKDKFMSTRFLLGLLPVFYGVALFSLSRLPWIIRKMTFSGEHEERVLLVGSVKRAESLFNWLKEKEAIGYKAMGLLTDDSVPGAASRIRILGGTDDIERVVKEHAVTQVIMVEFPMFSSWMMSMISVCERLGVRMTVICDFEEKFRHPVVLFEDAGRRFMSIREEPLEDPFNRFLKRALDLAVAVPVIVGILPFTTVIVWFFQRLQSPGPVIYRQPRAGLQNRPFDIIKYRTMRLHNQPVSKQATQDDPRIYPAGKWFRRLSIDELPQFINVLKGEMSVVGPRPHLLEHNEQFARAMTNYHIRAHVKPGITGLAQVRGYRGETRSEEDVVKRVQSDIYYLENWSFTLDCRIILATVFHVVGPPKTAY
jgi:exopolysaccharide biosynthesis polyprenyl glycosylphosphotransferase